MVLTRTNYSCFQKLLSKMEECFMFRCWTLLLPFAVTLPQSNAQSSAPVDMTAASGGSVMFTCSGTYVSWAVYTSSYTLIFDSRDNTVVSPNPSKYSIVGTSLMISGLDPAQDGTTYECRTNGTSLTRVNLVVIDQSSLKANIYSSGTLTVGNVVSFSCSQLSMTPDGQPLPETVGTYTQPTGGSGYHTKTLMCNHTLRATDGGKSLTCSVKSLGYTQLPAKVMLNLPYAPNRLNYTGNGDRVTCMANGSPAPTVTWIPITDGLSQKSGGRGGGSAVLTNMQSTVNLQVWTCVASNDYGNFSSGQIKIYVAGVETGQAQPKPNSSWAIHQNVQAHADVLWWTLIATGIAMCIVA